MMITLMINGTNTTMSWQDFATQLTQVDCSTGRCSTAIATSGALNVAYLIICALLVLLMQAGFVMLEVGSVHVRATKHLLTKSLFECCITAVLFYCYAFTLAFVGGDDMFGYSGGFFLQGTFSALKEHATFDGFAEAFWFLHWAIACVCMSIVSGAVAGRIRFSATVLYTILFTSLIYPVAVHWAWSSTGWASPYRENPLFGTGVIDFAGSGVIHATGGIAALMACVAMGPRDGRFDPYGEAIPTEFFTQRRLLSLGWHSIGTMFMWLGFLGLHLGSAWGLNAVNQVAIARIAINSTLAAAVSGAFTLLWAKLWTFRVDRNKGIPFFEFYTSHLVYANNGFLGGLVSIAAGCATVEPEMALVIGFFASVVYFFSSVEFLLYGLDDPVDAVPIHLMCGVWGLLAAGLFSTSDNYSDAYVGLEPSCGMFFSCNGNGLNQFAANALFLVVTVAWTSTLTALLFFPLQSLSLLRITSDEERGLSFLEEFAGNKADSIPSVFSLGNKYRFKSRTAPSHSHPHYTMMPQDS